ncbi:glycosyltransferase [Fusobacterium sp.]|uniref:glycosyltransferase n=1 Tax=Fusobacterium sp. TaxID=68766 RepID=UPI0029029A72|nr:glycosyltransferase [Fusobacterium sp.]MDU1912140.1 glycosyltransferase [Fusobacterium sp.]
MKRILFKSGSTMMGGLERVQCEYINFLVDEGFDIKVVIENDNGNENILEKEIKTKVEYLKNYEYISQIRKIRENRKKSFFLRVKYAIALFNEKRYADKKFLEIYKEFKPDIVIDFDSSLTKIIKELKISKNLVWVHSSVENWKKKKNKIKRFTKRLEYYNKIICICQEMEEDLLKLNNNLLGKSEYIYNPIDFEKIKILSDAPFHEEEKKLVKEKFLLMVSRLDIIPKDFETLFSAFDIAKEKGYEGRLYLIGDGPDKEKVEKMRENFKYKEEILLLGRKQNPYNWMKKADKLILSSRYEGFSVVLLEGIVLNGKVISSNCKVGPKEILADGRGKLFEVGDIVELSKNILKNFDLNFEENFLEKFNRKAIFEKFLRILEEIND